MTRCVLTGLVGVLMTALALSSLAAEAQQPDKKQKSPRQAAAQKAVTGVIDKVLVKQQQIVVSPQSGVQIQTQAAAAPQKASEPLTIRVDRNTEITGAAVEPDKFGKGQPLQQEAPAQGKAKQPKSEDPSQSVQQQEPKQQQQAPHPISLLAQGQLVRVVYVEVVRKVAAAKPPKQEQTLDKAGEDELKGAPAVGQQEKKDETAQQATPDVSEKAILRAVSVEILEAVASAPEQKAK